LFPLPHTQWHIAETAERMGVKKEDLNLRLGLFGSEASTAEMHRALTESWAYLQATITVLPK
jgi:phenylacetate-coenzyme A ligase PaaK-like adenylate-forming protein